MDYNYTLHNEQHHRAAHAKKQTKIRKSDVPQTNMAANTREIAGSTGNQIEHILELPTVYLFIYFPTF